MNQLLRIATLWVAFIFRLAIHPNCEVTFGPGVIAQEPAARIHDAIEEIVRTQVETKQIPAFSIALVNSKGVLWAEGFGFCDEGRTIKANASTIYRMGSVSKLLTDLAVMQLVERGELSLDNPVVDVLPGFAPVSSTDSQPITLRMLMSHRSGLVREPPVGNYFDSTSPSLESTVQSLNQTSLVYPPGTRTKYSNAGLAVVGQMLATRRQMAFADCLEESILRPLGMTHSHFRSVHAPDAAHATGWMWTRDGRRFKAPSFELGMAPAGNMYSSVLDMAKFAQCILNHGQLTDGRQVISADTLRIMTTPSKGPDGSELPFGIGFVVGRLDGHRRIGHDGAIYGHSTRLAILPDDDLAVIAVASLDGANGIVDRLADHALRLMLAARDGAATPEWVATTTVPTERIQSLAGEYTDERGRITISAHGDRCLLQTDTSWYDIRLRSDSGALVIDDVQGFGSAIQQESEGRLRVGNRLLSREPDLIPAPCREEWTELIGEYGDDHNVLYLLEDHGRLCVLIEWFYQYPLTQLSEDEFAFPETGLYHGEKLVILRGSNQEVIGVRAAGVEFRRRDVGTAHGTTFQITPLRPVEELRAESLAASPPEESGDFLTTQLVQPKSLDPTIRLDVRYATTNNFMGAVFYQSPKAFLQKPAADALVRVQRRLASRGLGVLIHDAYRPWYVTRMFWEATPESMRDFVANPSRGSRHNRGCAVDLTICELETGKPVEMVSGYDEFSPRAFPLYPGGTSRERWYRTLLRTEMEAEGFTVYEFEWWHFDYRDWKQYRIGNATFEQLE